jgi:hypothetical protein
VIRFVSQSTQRQMIWVDIPRDATPAQRRVRYTLSSGGGLAEGKKGQQLNPPLVKCDNKGCLGSSFSFCFSYFLPVYHLDDFAVSLAFRFHHGAAVDVQ